MHLRTDKTVNERCKQTLKKVGILHSLIFSEAPHVNSPLFEIERVQMWQSARPDTRIEPSRLSRGNNLYCNIQITFSYLTFNVTHLFKSLAYYIPLMFSLP